MMAYSKNTKIISMNGGFVVNAVCDSCNTVIPAEAGLKERLETALSETKLQEYKVTEEKGTLNIYAKGVPAHASTPTLGVNAAGVTFECLEKAGFEDDFVTFYNTHLGTSCDGAGIGLKFADAYGDLTFCNGIVKTEDGVISCTIDIRVPVTLKGDEVRKMCEDRLEDENGRVVDTEMQNKSQNRVVQEELPLRVRYYQGMIDQEILSSGTDYIFLKETYIIFICTYDPFGKGKYVYHFHMACDEDEEIQLQDKMNWIFYNTTADLSEAPEGIREFLSYVENEIVDGDFTKLLDKEVKNARLNEDWRSEYLKTYVNDMDMRREGYVEGEKRGRAEGKKRGRAEGEKVMQKKLLQNLMETQKITEAEAKNMLGI